MTKNMKRIHKVTLKRIVDDIARYDNEGQGSNRTEYIGIRADAEIALAPSHAPGMNPFTGPLQTITSGGLWGIESDSDADYLKSVEDEQLAELRNQLHAIGFSQRAITAAFRNVERG